MNGIALWPNDSVTSLNIRLLETAQMNFKTFHKLKEAVFVRRNFTDVWNIQPRHRKTKAY